MSLLNDADITNVMTQLLKLNQEKLETLPLKRTPTNNGDRHSCFYNLWGEEQEEESAPQSITRYDLMTGMDSKLDERGKTTKQMRLSSDERALSQNFLS